MRRKEKNIAQFNSSNVDKSAKRMIATSEKEEKMVLSDGDECASIWISRTKKKCLRCDGKGDEQKIQFSRFSIVLKRTSRRTAANLYSLHHYNLLSFCRFFRSLLFGRLRWLLVPTYDTRVWWGGAAAAAPLFLFIPTLCGPFCLSFSFILFLLPFSGVIFT